MVRNETFADGAAWRIDLYHVCLRSYLVAHCTTGTTLVLLLTLVLAACGSDDEIAAVGGDASSEEEQRDYVMYLEGALRDTLSGAARFGRVVNPENGRRRLVIELALGGEAGSGAYFSPGDTTMPDAGSHPLAAVDSAGDDRFTFDFRQGMIRELSAEEGTLTLEQVSDTLITGTFEARLVGRVVNVDRRPGELPNEGESTVQARGRFEARRGPVGFVIGS